MVAPAANRSCTSLTRFLSKLRFYANKIGKYHWMLADFFLHLCRYDFRCKLQFCTISKLLFGKIIKFYPPWELARLADS